MSQTVDDSIPVRSHKIRNWSKPHVASQCSQPCSKTRPISPDYLYRSLVSRYNDVTALDSLIENFGGITSTLECLPHRLQMRKRKSNNLNERIEELTVENECLQEESIYYKDTRAVLIKFFENINSSIQTIKGLLYETSKDVAISEQ